MFFWILQKPYIDYFFLEGNNKYTYLTNEEFRIVNDLLYIYGIEPGILPNVVEYVCFNHDQLDIKYSTLTTSDMELLFNRHEYFTYISINNVRILDDQLNELPEEQSFKFLLTAFSKTKADNVTFLICIVSTTELARVAEGMQLQIWAD